MNLVSGVRASSHFSSPFWTTIFVSVSSDFEVQRDHYHAALNLPLPQEVENFLGGVKRESLSVMPHLSVIFANVSSPSTF